jgi:hypothetical protein
VCECLWAHVIGFGFLASVQVSADYFPVTASLGSSVPTECPHEPQRLEMMLSDLSLLTGETQSGGRSSLWGRAGWLAAMMPGVDRAVFP